MLLTVAVIGSAHGLRGEVRLDVRTDNPAQRLAPGTVLPTEGGPLAELTVERVRRDGEKVYARFVEIADRTAAEALRGVRLLVDADAEEDAEDDAYYPHQLRGLRVEHVDGRELGVVKDLLPGAAQDLLVVKAAGGEVLVPFVSAIAREVDLVGARVVLDPPGGMFPGLGEAL
ncbi:ribosome maturation factor RimM [Buchananella felis]|uniref:ribosome maturation factor RimM n=1 Tax=Buchananella felis TaxID=3231492 RepID=UPI003528E3F9